MAIGWPGYPEIHRWTVQGDALLLAAFETLEVRKRLVEGGSSA